MDLLEALFSTLDKRHTLPSVAGATICGVVVPHTSVSVVTLDLSFFFSNVFDFFF